MEYAVYWNSAAACGGIEPVKNWWSSDHPEGDRHQDIGGPHDTFMRAFSSKQAAKAFLKSLYEAAG